MNDQIKDPRAPEAGSPFGVVRFRKGDMKVLWASERAWEIMGLDPDRRALREHVAENLERIVPVSQHAAFSLLLAAAERDGSVEFDTELARADGEAVEIACWLAAEGAGAAPVYRLTIADVTRKRRLARERRRTDRVGYLSSQYDVVFLVEATGRRARCLHFEGDELFERLRGLRMELADVAAYLADRLAAKEDREALRAFLATSTEPISEAEQGHRRLVFSALEGGGCRREALIVAAESGEAFLCSRPIGETAGPAPTAPTAVEALDREAIVVTESLPHGGERIVYLNDAARSLFGIGVRDLADASPERLLAAASFDPQVATELVRQGTAEAVRTGGGAYRLLLDTTPATPAVRVLRALPRARKAAGRAPRVSIRTFRYFEVFVDGEPIPFGSEKAKELLALLVDRRGGFVTSDDAIAALWEHEPISERSRTRYRKAALHLKNTLAAYGAEGIIESVRGKRRLVPERVRCDLFSYLDREPGSEGLFRGSYLSNYSWAEVTLSELSYR